MERIKVTVYLPVGEFQMELVQFIAFPDPKKETEILAICMDSEGNFNTYGLGDIKAKL